ncbi:hypothetical protein ZIOFF_016168 [Zingiber officinale]|uniref:BTB domain-containing protein n=1 Tax=Zingiber officinale TaxID=94328 RepID=A0A8J5HE09_ZINOF|nr:hypothetical protein ZIOFF_016168 [Zingiber officinale]
MVEDDLRIPELVRRWKDLEHLEMETKPSSFLEAVVEIGRNCPRFVGLKVRGLIGREDAKALAQCLPELKHLELRKSYLTKDELLVVIGGCRKLETLTVKDCLGFQADDEILKLVSRIEWFEHEGSMLVYSYTCSNIGSRSTLQRIASLMTWIFSDVAGDVTIYVDGQSFLLHKFPMVSRSGKIWKMVVESREPDLSRLELHEVPGGAEAFELAAKFCYGTNFEITASNVAQLRCIAEYLEMTEQYQERNLIVRAEALLNEFTNLKYSRVEIDEVRFEWAECMLDYI